MKIRLFALLCVLFATTAFAKTRKAVFIIIDGVPADMIERLNTPAIDEIAARGSFERAYTGGEVGGYSQTPTISAIGYTNLLTATWLNKHNVGGNSNLKPNYNYWTIFRIAKEQKKDYKTAIYSSWTDNRTVLLGEGKPETGNLKIDYVCDGYDLDTKRFPKKEKELHIFDIDEFVTKQAAQGIKNDAPDLSWVYLWYTDDAGHIEGNGKFFDEYTLKADQQIAQIWEAVKYREANFDEEWMVVVTTDHGRSENGHDHGGQSERERTTWISTNQPVNRHFHNGQLAITDITPSICRFMGFEVPQPVLWEQDGMPFIGPVDIANMKTSPYDEDIILSWDCLNPNAEVTVYAATDNLYKTDGKDEWIKLGTVPASYRSYQVKSGQLPASKFYKFVLQTPNNHLNRWVQR
ncbi:MAG: alkaline phosphatase family protein [Bacteroidales bacterium]|nr:alkaline phosphatase family protein [Bacteroidales bacterium]